MKIAARWPSSCISARRRPIGISILLALTLIELQGADGKRITLNAAEATYFREPREGDHFVKGAHCLVFLSDGRFVSVVETCDQVESKIKAAGQMTWRSNRSR